ncbi:hypothetical protein [Streptomyces alboflavus]|uniref:hypothetical protein n=1 Tax=Streptomyces alboflavus TaxID=67267 RepID=UPI003682798C
MDDNHGDPASDPALTRLVDARRKLDEASAGVRVMAAAVDDLSVCGTDELPAALAALDTQYVDEEEDAARRVSDAFTLGPMEAISSGGGEPVLALSGAVMMLRGALLALDEAKKEV